MTKKQNKIIETFNVPDPSDDLADRIIMQARQTPQKITWTQRLQSFLPDMSAPALSYSFASLLIVGLLIAGVMYNNIPTPQSSSNEYSVDYAMDEFFGDEDDLLIL